MPGRIRCGLCGRDIEFNQRPVISDRYTGTYHSHCMKVIEAFDAEHDCEEFDTQDVDLWLEEKICSECWKYEDGLCTEPNTAACIKTYEHFGKEEYYGLLGIVQEG